MPGSTNVSGLGKRKHREFAMASGEMSQSEFTQFLKTAFEQLCSASADGSIHYICMDWRHLREVLDARALLCCTVGHIAPSPGAWFRYPKLTF